MTTKLTKTQFPLIYRAAELMFQDQGMSAPRRFFVEMELLTENEGGVPVNLTLVEAFLSRLSADDFETFCVGDQEDQIEISQREPDGEASRVALDNLFMTIGG